MNRYNVLNISNYDVYQQLSVPIVGKYLSVP